MEKNIVGVKFRESGKIYNFEPNKEELKKGDYVIVQTNNGEEFGHVVLDPRITPIENEEELLPIIRKATQEDLAYHEHLLELGKEAKEIFNKEVNNHGLEMKLIDVIYTFDAKKVIFYYTADGRVDFRNLVRDLAGYFHARIELRQIGVRDEARKYCGIGVCGRKCCCSCWLSDFVPVSIKMAKEQNLSLNSTKISGVCGRLLCCLKYEQDYYEEVSKKMPRIGDKLKTPDGSGTVYKLNTLDQAVLMKIVNDRDEVEIKRYTVEELDKAAQEPTLPVVEEAKEIILNEEPPDQEPTKISKPHFTKRKKRPRRRSPGKIEKSKFTKKRNSRLESKSSKESNKKNKSVKSKRSKRNTTNSRNTKRFSGSNKRFNKLSKRTGSQRKRRPKSRYQSSNEK